LYDALDEQFSYDSRDMNLDAPISINLDDRKAREFDKKNSIYVDPNVLQIDIQKCIPDKDHPENYEKKETIVSKSTLSR
jgi:hypothetical protein